MEKAFLKTFSFLIAVFAVLLMNSCTKTSDKNEYSYILMGNASGSQEVPSVSSHGTASLDGIYNADNKTLKYTINWSGLSDTVNAVNLHGPATVDASADILAGFDVINSSVNGKSSGTITLDDSMINALLNGNIYYDISTAAYPNGEIRGQIIAIHE